MTGDVRSRSHQEGYAAGRYDCERELARALDIEDVTVRWADLLAMAQRFAVAVGALNEALRERRR